MDDLVVDWKKELGWEKNPFEHKILEPVEGYLGGYEKEQQKLNLFILNEKKYGTIQGVAGSGKSTLLHWLLETLEKHKNKFTCIYLIGDDFKDDKKLVDKLSAPFMSDHAVKIFLKKLSGKGALTKKNIDAFIAEHCGTRRVILLIDSVSLTKDDLDVCLRLLKLPQVSLIIVGKNPCKDEKDDLALDLKKLDFEGAKAMVKKRIESVGGNEIWPFSDKILKDLFGLADYIPGRILPLCHERAKELAIDVRSGKIVKPKKGMFLQHDVIQHDVQVMDKPLEHPPVEKKHSGGGFGIKFVVVDDDEQKLAKEITTFKEEIVQPDDDENVEESKKEADAIAIGVKYEKKKDEKNQGKTFEKNIEKKGKVEPAPVKSKESTKESIKESTKGNTEESSKEDLSIIQINLGYEDAPKKKEQKPKKMEAFTIDVSPPKKKK
jgi:hypothetical protein